MVSQHAGRKAIALTIAAAATIATAGLTHHTTTEPAPAGPDAHRAVTTNSPGSAVGLPPAPAPITSRSILEGGGPAEGSPDTATRLPAAHDTDGDAGGSGPDGAPDAGTRDELPGAGSTPPAEPSDPIGELDDQRPVPAGFDFTAPPKRPGAPNGLGGAGDLAVAPSCSHQCITRGVAYPRGFGAELIVETSIPAQLFITAIADLDHDGVYEDVHVESTPHAVTAHSWALDHLQPGETYHVMAAATDEHGHTAHAWGQFTTLSTRDVFVEFGSGEIVGGPGDVSGTRWSLGLDGPLTDVTPGNQGVLLYRDLPRHVDVDFWVIRDWEDDLCEHWSPTATPQGHDTYACVAWNSTSLAAVDLDEAPAGSTRWTQSSVTRSLQPPSGAGGALPPGYGDPYYFWFDVPITFHVTYS